MVCTRTARPAATVTPVSTRVRRTTSTQTRSSRCHATRSRSRTATRTTTRLATPARLATPCGHDNVFMRNATGVSTDSLFPEHPGLPQNHAKFERNVIADNNADYYAYVRDGTCNKPQIDRGYENGVVCPCVGIPTGTG